MSREKRLEKIMKKDTKTPQDAFEFNEEVFGMLEEKAKELGEEDEFKKFKKAWGKFVDGTKP